MYDYVSAENLWSCKQKKKLDGLLSGSCTRVGRAQLYRLSLVDAHTVAQNQYTGIFFTIFTFFVMALCYVQKCELS